MSYTLLQFVSYINCDNFLHWYCPESITKTIYLYLGGSFTTCLFCLYLLYETYCCMSYCMMVIAGQKCMENSLRSTISPLQACLSVQLSILSFLVNGNKGMKIGEGRVHLVQKGGIISWQFHHLWLYFHLWSLRGVSTLGE